MTIQHKNLGIILFIILTIPHIVVRGLGDNCTTHADCDPDSETCESVVCACKLSYEVIGTACVKTCPPPPPIDNGNGVTSQNYTTLSFEAIYTCTEGSIVGNNKLECDGQGNWTGEVPVCDPCVTNPCPVLGGTQVGCTANVSGSGHVCICPDGFKGADCSITDNPIVCDSRTKNIRFELNPDEQNRTRCVRKKDTNETAACYPGDDGEEIIYSFDPTGYDISIDDRNEKYCLTYLIASDVPTLCINITAHESNDFNYRPWINSTLELCFIFNKIPRITGIPPVDLRFNVVDMATEATVTLLATNPEEHQTLTWSISKVIPEERNSFVSIQGENLIIQNPNDTTTDWNDDIYNTPTIVETMVTDNGMPPLDDVRNFTVVYKYLDFVCSADEELYRLHLDPFPQSVKQLGTIQCAVNGNPNFNGTPNFNITSDPGPVVVTSDGEIQYDPDATNNQGTFSLTVEGAVTLLGFNLTSDVTFSVVADDLQPSCTETGNTATFSEKAVVGTCSNVLYTCSDPEGLDKNCTVQSDNFYVTCNVSGSNDVEVLLCIDASIDFMGGSTETVTINVWNDYGTVTVSADVTIDNVNDPPVLQPETSPIVLTVAENTTAGGVLVIIPVDDPDMGPNPPLDTLSATLTDLDMSNDGALPFEVNMSFGNSVSLVLTGPLNGAVRDVYNMSIKVEDSAGLSDAVVVTVTVQDVNEAPVCDQTYITAHATVRDVVGDTVAQLSCSDNDFESPFNDLTYSIQESVSAAYFQVDVNGAITLKTSLADLTDNLLSFTVDVVDGGNLGTSVTVEVNVTSDYPPNCDASIVSKDVSEKSTSTDCFTVIIPCVDDVDSAGQLNYIVNSGNGSASFSVQDTTLNNQNWSVCPTSDLQGQVGQYIFNGVVRSQYGDTDVQVIINVEDVNDPPACVDTEVSETVAVTQLQGHVIKSLSCTDLDIAPDFKTLIYSITEDTNGYFAVSSNGVVSLAQRLTDITSSGTVLSFNIEVSDNGGLKVNIPAQVTVEANFPPVCGQLEVTKSIDENTNADFCFTIENVCEDIVNNETLSYNVLNGTGTSLFIIKSKESTNAALKVCTQVSLQGNYGDWELNVGVTSSFGLTTVSVIITVIDQNEAPTFVAIQNPVEVLENVTLSTVIYTLSAADPDSGVFGQLTYSSADIDNSNQFSLDANTGEIKVISTLDAETSTRYEFNIEVKDGGNHTDTATLVVMIQDTNDEKPQCTSTSNNITLHLLSPVGKTVIALQCTDADITDEFSQIVFSTTSDLFQVDNNGTVTLSSTLPRDQTSHVIYIEAGDANKPGNTNFITNIVIYVHVDRNAPPDCDSTSIFLDVTEQETVGKCVDREIICQDPTNQLVTFTKQEGNASSLFEIRTNNNTATLGLNACIRSSLKDQFNTFILIGTISNGLGTTAIQWTITIKNVNEAPVFTGGPYSQDLSESTSVSQTPVLVITVTDPDNGKGDPNFELLVTSINATVTNDDDYNQMIRDAFLFVPSTASFYAIKKFNATIRDLYTFTVTATDNEGLSSTTEVTFNITDENSAPLCDPWSVQASIDILASIGTEVVNVACFDTDIYPQNTALDYQMSNTNSDQYFNVTPDGLIIVNKKLPRTLLNNTGHAIFHVVVSDRGSPALSASVTVNITVNNDIPVECSPVITPPNVWVQDSCMNITMDCTDPTLEGTDHLSYTPSGNYTSDFELTSNLRGVLTLCYKNTISSVYEISINVDNGLKAAMFTEMIVVSYSQATPVFTLSKYTKTVSENTATGASVLSVSATSSDLVDQLVYTVIDAPSTWVTYLSLDSSTGVISTLQPLKSIANTVIALKVEALDTGSKLKSLAQVEITVEDINEAPSCGVTSTSLNNLDVNSDVGTIIVKYNCSDPDVKTEYNSLTFTLSGDSVTTYFKLVGDPPDSIAVKTPLNVSIESYSINLIVQDGGTPPLSVTRVFEVTVSTLPPPVEVKVLSKTHTSILINFYYVRADFYAVTQYFKAKALTVNNELVQESIQLGNMAQTYNITGLQAETAYIVKVEAITTSSKTIASKTMVVITKVVPVFSFITFSFVIPKVEFNNRLRDEGSQLYYTNRADVETNLGIVLKSDKGYSGISRMMFRPWNSILVDLVIALNQSADAESTMDTLEQSVKTGWLNDLSVDSSYFVGSPGAGYISVADIIQSPISEIHNGTVVSLECKVETIGYLETDIFKIWWTFQGNVIQPTEQSRYHITTTSETLLYENKLSVLRIDPISTTNAGQYGCHVSDSQQQEEKKFYGVKVIGQPMVIVEPRSQTVQYGDNVSVTCFLVFSPGVFERFVWYRNGEPYIQASNEDLQENGTVSNISVRDIKLSVTFGCEGVNQAGSSVRAMTTISVIPPDITKNEMCPIVTDRGITWPWSAPGAVVRLNCSTDYTGERYRECDATGRWKLPVYNCVKNQLRLIEEQVNQLKDGASSTTLDKVLDDMETETGDTDLYEGDLETAVNTLDNVVDITSSTDKDKIVEETENFLEIASNLIDDRNKDSWMSCIEERKKGAIGIARLVESYLDKKLDNLVTDDEDSYSVKNIYVHVGAIKQATYNFPDRTRTELPDWVGTSGTGLKIPGDAFKDLPTVHYASSFYRDISSILVKKLKVEGTVEDITEKYDINSDIISFQVKEGITKLSTPAEITFQHFNSNYSKPLCTYWDFDEGAFLTDGIVLVSTNDDFTVCSSDHFTNFALLMSPGKTPEADLMALSIISAVGCAISILCLVLTIVLYLVVWRHVKSDRAILLLNLCVALIISYVIFLAGINRAENATICTVISALLHYFYLVVFFLMLAYGIEIAVCVVYVFVTRSRLTWLLPLAWGIPLIIVGISLGATQLEGYGNDRFCWLSTEDGVLWAFVGPAILIIIINFVIVVIVLRQMFKSSAMMTKSDKEKAVTGVRSICVLLPILGLTWIFGVFSVNESMVAFQYIFAICNTLQGFLIFLFHCILNKQLKQALKQRNERKKSMASIENTFKNPQSTASSGAFYSSDSKSTQQKNNLDSETTETSNPFLQADRQMNALVAKNKTGGNVNEVNNKLDKDIKNKPVDLDDVKISNILRESEVMGGTAGISSILQEQPKDELPSIRDTNASSHRYEYVDPYGMNRVSHDNSAHGSGSAKHSAHSDRSRERKYELEREREEERLKQIEYEKRDRQERDRKEREKREREKIERDRERQEHERKDRERREKEKHKNKNVIKIGYGSDTYLGGASRSRDHSHERRGPSRPQGPSRADDDYEGNISSISTALPEKFDFYQGNKRQKEAKKKEKKKSSLKDRSKDRSAPYEYSYESTYLGGNSRHASLENMSAQQYIYSPYAQMPGMGGYQTGRPTHQQQHWDQYRYPRDPRDPYGRDHY